ncbi:MAG: TIGR02302 family protein [Hyphomicrobiaceae bacterium]|nr:TIGR02302 family protein [Hyphomicrobiaceae bacterium]
MDAPADIRRQRLERAFERKVRRSRWAIVFERLWPRLWLTAAVLGAFLLVSVMGIWSRLSDPVHWAVLGAFGVALLASLVVLVRIPWPTREAAVRRMERVSGIAHRPASSYEDTMSSASGDATTRALWTAHRQRLAEKMTRLRVGHPEPATHRYDPLALRAVLVLASVVIVALLGQSLPGHLREAFRFSDERILAASRLDAWVTPPGYTGKAPIMLADGARDAAAEPLPSAKGALEVPAKSQLIVRSSGARNLSPVLEVQVLGASEVERIEAVAPEAAHSSRAAAGSGVVELRYELTTPARIRVLALGSEMAAWTFDVTPDALPTIALTKKPERSARGAMKLTYKVADDYGVASAVAKLEQLKSGPDSSAASNVPELAWARKKPLSGPRPPLERPPVLTLKLPRAGITAAETFTHLEMGRHPWAGLTVEMTLEAKDVAGQVGRSETMVIELPQRRFDNPVARAVIEQRRKLVQDPRYRPEVLAAIEALTLEPEGFLDDIPAFVGLRMAYHKLARETTREARNGVIEQLWDVAVRLEDGDLSDAERRLREAQEKLAKMLEDGASEKEIADAMKELREALNDYLRELAEQNQDRQNEFADGLDKNQQTLSPRDLEQMMKNIEEMAKNGSRDQAKQMLSELRDLLDRLQSSKQSEAQNQRNREMMQKMDELGGLVGKQQQLMDDTYGEMRQDGPKGQKGQKGQRGEQRGQRPGQRGERGEGERQQGQGQRGQGQQGQGQQGQQGQGQRGNGPPDQAGLGERQRALRDELGRLQRELDELGLGKSDQLDAAREAMESAEQALQEGDLDTATDEQSRALDQMRQGAQQMAKEMLQNMPQRFGQNGDTPRDPLGRPQRSQGPDLGTSVKVPDEIDRQRAREILEELRRRIGQQTRPPEELDYIERLLRRF